MLNIMDCQRAQQLSGALFYWSRIDGRLDVTRLRLLEAHIFASVQIHTNGAPRFSLTRIHTQLMSCFAIFRSFSLLIMFPLPARVTLGMNQDRVHVLIRFPEGSLPRIERFLLAR